MLLGVSIKLGKYYPRVSQLKSLVNMILKYGIMLILLEKSS